MSDDLSTLFPRQPRPWLAIGLLVLTGACGGAEPAAESQDANEQTTSGGDEAASEAESATEDDEDASEADATDEASEDAASDDAERAGEVEEPAQTDEEAQLAWRTQVRRGRRIFERVCGTCHPGGDEDLGPRIIGKGLTVARVRRQIREGIGRMRPIPPSKLPERYMDELFAYLSTLRVVRGVPRP